MQRADWQRHTTWETVCKRNSGRRHYNSVRQFRAELRRRQILAYLRAGMRQRAIAAALNVSEATISRDVAALLERRSLWP
jgi:DNA-binding NarL/FixJ family response regulator